MDPTSLVCVGTEIDVLPAFLGQATQKVWGHGTAYDEAGSQWSVVPTITSAGPRPDLFWTTKEQEEARTTSALQAIPGLTPIFVLETTGEELTPLGIAFALAEAIKLTQAASLVVVTPGSN